MGRQGDPDGFPSVATPIRVIGGFPKEGLLRTGQTGSGWDETFASLAHLF
jgi:hypothetical protein